MMPPHDVYIEPFLGGAAIMRLKRPARLNIGLDLDPAVLETAAAVLAVVDTKRTDTTRNDTKRHEIDRCRREIEQFQGMLRAGECPERMEGLLQAIQDWGAELRILESESREMAMSAGKPASSPLAGSGEHSSFVFHNGCGIKFLENYTFTGAELVYCDPPYVMETRRGGRLYRHEMTDAEHVRLLAVLRTLRCRVIVSGYWSVLYEEALEGWNTISFDVMTRRGTATETLWWNFPLPVELHDYRYLGTNFRERERIKRKKNRWTARLARMPLLERQALLCAIAETNPTR